MNRSSIFGRTSKFGVDSSRPVKQDLRPTAPRVHSPKVRLSSAGTGAKVTRQQGKAYGRP